MRILIISQYFVPEIGAAANRVGSFARYLSDFGHQVSVVCQVPNYPSGKIYPGYKNLLKSISKESGFKVIRQLTYPSDNTKIFKRLTNYLFFAFGSLFTVLGEKRPDVVLFSSPPIFAGITALPLSFLWRVPLVVDVRDIWPGVAAESGNLFRRVLLSPLRFLEICLYRRASAVVTVSGGMTDLLVKENPILKGKVFSVYNGVDTSESYRVVWEKGRSNEFVVIYSGTIGTQQKLSTLIKAAEQLKTHRRIKFLICGAGVEDELILRKIKTGDLKNVKHLGLLSRKDALGQVALADVGLVMLVGSKYNDPALPSKVFDYFLAEKPVLASAGQFLKKFVEREGTGFWVEPNNPKKLAEKILEISKFPEAELRRMGKRGKNLVETTYNRGVQAKKLEEILESLPFRVNINKHAAAR